MPGQAVADYWHNPVLSLGSVDDWLRQAKAAVPDLDEQLKQSSLRSGRSIEDLKRLADEKAKTDSNTAKGDGKGPVRGGNLQANLTPQQQALLARKARDCLEVLAFMKRGNINPREFPRFPLEKIPEYRKTAGQLLRLMGPAGDEAVMGRLRSHLMSGFPSRADVSYHDQYVRELLDVLGRAAGSGRLTGKDLHDLDQAMRGNKPPAVKRLAVEIEKTLSQTLSIETLLDWANATESRSRKTEIIDWFKKRLADASRAELERFFNDDELDARVKKAVVAQLRKYIPEMRVPGLLNLFAVNDAAVKRDAERALRKERTYEDVKDEIQQIWSAAKSDDRRVAAYAEWHTANAFQQAPISHCLHWISQGDGELAKVIWKQVEARIARADAARKRAYAKTALKGVAIEEIGIAGRVACLELLGRVKDRSSVEQIVQLLPRMPRELWPPAGFALKKITGKDYGPKPGDGAAEVVVAVKHWRAWIQQNEQ